MTKHSLLSAYILLLFAFSASAQTVTDSVLIHFRQSKVNLDTAYMDNPEALRHVRERISAYSSPDSALKLTHVRVIGGASPEGSVRYNEWLSRERADRIFEHLSRTLDIPDSITSFTFLGRDWKGLRQRVMLDPNVPDRKEVLSLLDEIINRSASGETESMRNLQRLKALGGGKPYLYLYRKHFPSLRESRLTLDFERPMPVRIEEPTVTDAIIPEPVIIRDTVFVERIVYWCPPCKPFYMDLKTNMLFDALAVPNLGVEFYLGKNISIAAQWMYGWWDNRPKNYWWRIYGGELDLRWWFGRQAHEKPLTGHHFGVYGGVVTYDFELGKTGYMGGLPGKTLWDRCNYQAGVEYGYSLPVTKRLNIDFTIGIGYFGGKYIVYEPNGKCYEWQETRMRNWFGPTKAEVSLVWLIGCDNYNRPKAKAKAQKGGAL